MPSGFRGQCPLRGLWLLICHITNIILIFRAASRKIWAWRLCDGRQLQRWAWLLFVLCIFRCVIIFLVTVRIHYSFSYFILRQQMSPFHMWNLTTLHVEENSSATTVSYSKLSAERNRTSARYFGGNVSFHHLRTVTHLPVNNTIRFYDPNIPFTKCKNQLPAQYFFMTYDTYAFRAN